MKKKLIEWITFNAFLDTDLYIVKELAIYYDINWHIIRSANDKFEYISTIEKLKSKNGLNVYLHVCGKRLRKLECISYYNKLFIEIGEHKPDMIFTSLAGAPYFIPILANKVNISKTVLAIHNAHVPKGGSAYYFFKLYNKYAISRFYNFQTFSKSQFENLKKLVPDKNILYAPFILKDYGRPDKNRTSNMLTFLNFGNIRAYKRIDVLIDASQRVYEKTGRRFRVIIAGKCDDWEKYQKIIKYDFLFDLRIARVENEDIPNLFQEADYFVAPYQDIAQSGSSIIAINYGKPIIASKLPAFEEYIEDKITGYLMQPADVDSLEKIMEEIFQTHEVVYEKMVKNIQCVRQNVFATRKIVQKYREFFDYVIEK